MPCTYYEAPEEAKQHQRNRNRLLEKHMLQFARTKTLMREAGLTIVDDVYSRENLGDVTEQLCTFYSGEPPTEGDALEWWKEHTAQDVERLKKEHEAATSAVKELEEKLIMANEDLARVDE